MVVGEGLEAEIHGREKVHHVLADRVGPAGVAGPPLLVELGLAEHDLVVRGNAAPVVHRHLEVGEGDIGIPEDRPDSGEGVGPLLSRIHLDQRLTHDGKRDARFVVVLPGGRIATRRRQRGKEQRQACGALW